MKKKFLSIVISLLCVLLISFINVSAEEYNDFSYYIFNEEIVISSYNGTDTNITIPKEINGQMVTTISETFTGTSVKEFDSITIPDSITKLVSPYGGIDKTPFRNTRVSQYIVDESNSSFASYNGAIYSKDLKTLYRCPSNQTTSSLYRGVEVIDGGAFINTDYEILTIPSSVNEIVQDYSLGILSGFENLQNLIVEEENQYYCILNDALYEKRNGEVILLKYLLGEKTETYQIAEGTTKIAECAFKGNNIKSVKFPTTMTSLSSYAFMDCTSLETVTIPEYITYLDRGVFQGCSNLVSVDMGNGITETGLYVFLGCENLKNVTLSNNLYRLESGTFSNCSTIEEIVIPEGVKEISGWAFRNCPNLVNVIIPKSISYMDQGIFVSCDNVILNVYENSYGLQYAIENDMDYKIISDTKIGDINGDDKIGYSDAVLVLQSDSDILELSESQKIAADVNNDGIINYSDAVQILRYDAGLITGF